MICSFLCFDEIRESQETIQILAVEERGTPSTTPPAECRVMAKRSPRKPMRHHQRVDSIESSGSSNDKVSQKKASRAVIDWGSESFAVSVFQRLRKVYLVREQLLPASSQKLVPVTWHRMSEDENNFMVVIETKLLYYRYSVIVEPMIAPASENKMKVVITNYSSLAILLPYQMTIGLIEESTRIEDIELSGDEC
ncbi:hypothetical protein HPB51_019378 [Rhipicephalus microplus]|uniref:Uncharacterized protein n=1 Tax=Rhipicephalus microplus TaxID=6941 RepID=A0A9J6DB60_RHIMP|nr:hypothetical protein HPB51_019378 [Rhipicephalus microplus]